MSQLANVTRVRTLTVTRRVRALAGVDLDRFLQDIQRLPGAVTERLAGGASEPGPPAKQ